MTIKTIKPTALRTLTWGDLKAFGHYDKANRWTATDDRVKPYFDHIRTPSRAWPHSHSKGAQTKKFANWLCENCPELAQELRLMEV